MANSWGNSGNNGWLYFWGLQNYCSITPKSLPISLASDIVMVPAIHQHEMAIVIHMSPPSWISLLSPSLSYPSRLSQSTGFRCPASYIELALVIYFTYGNAYISVLFSQIIPPFHSLTESKSLFFTPVSPLLPCIWDCWYHFSKFHKYVLIYGICLSFFYLLHSV